MPRPRLPYLHRETTRHGKTVWFVRRDHGGRIRLRAEYGSQAFMAEYNDAIAGVKRDARPASARRSTLAWAIEEYRRSSAWAQLAPATRKQRENIYRAVAEANGTFRLAEIDAAAIREGRERRAATPHSANNFLKAMRGLFGWAVEHEHIVMDPTRGVKLLAGKNDDVGFHTWTEDEIARYEARWPLGTRERLAFDVLLYTGLRRGDAVRLGRQHVRGGIIRIRTEKTGVEVALPILPCLLASIEATVTGDLAFIVTERGTPFAKESFGNWFGDVCRRTGCPGSAHGMRKAGATRAAENGASDAQLMALFGWDDPKMAAHYRRAADRKRLAGDAAALLLPAQAQNEERPHLKSSAGGKTNSNAKSGT